VTMRHARASPPGRARCDRAKHAMSKPRFQVVEGSDGAGLRLPRIEDVRAVPAEKLPALIAELAALQAVAAIRLRTAPGQSRALTAGEVAADLRVPVEWVEKRSRSLPFRITLGDGTVRYDAAGLQRWRAARTGAVR
jgi:hypothetical protein